LRVFFSVLLAISPLYFLALAFALRIAVVSFWLCFGVCVQDDQEEFADVFEELIFLEPCDPLDAIGDSVDADIDEEVTEISSEPAGCGEPDGAGDPVVDDVPGAEAGGPHDVPGAEAGRPQGPHANATPADLKLRAPRAKGTRRLWLSNSVSKQVNLGVFEVSLCEVQFSLRCLPCR
jgi:hypothetical protein